jgi:hypothetical protein
MTNEWNIAVEGAAIFALPENQRFAKIVTPAPEYKVDEGSTNPDKSKTKLIMCVELSDGRKADYYPNRTSARKIASILRTDLTNEGMKKWIGKVIVWGKILDMLVGGQEKKVLYVTEVKDEFPVVKVGN